MDDTIRMDMVLHNLSGFSHGIFVARLLMCIGVYYYIGIVPSIITFIGFEAARQVTDNLLQWVKVKLAKKELSFNVAENILILDPLLKVIGVGIVFTFLNKSVNHNAHDASYLLLFGNLALQIYQNSNSMKLSLAATISSVFLIFAHVIIDGKSYIDIASFIAPVLFSMLMLALSLLSYRDRRRGLDIRKEMLDKTSRLQDLLYEQEKEKITGQNVERLAKVGRFSWLFKGAKYWSPGAYSAFGFDEAKAPPSNEEFLERIYEADRDNYIKNLKFARQNGTSFEFGFKIRGRDGELKHVFSHGAPILDNDGKTIGFDGIVVDQTHAAKALDSLESAKELLNLALINGRSVVLEHDLENGAIRGYGALDIFDFAQDDDPNRLEDKVMRCLGRRDTHIVFGAMGRAEASGEIQYAEHRIVHSDGEELNVRVAMGIEGSLENGKGRLISITTDITDEVQRRHELANALHESQRASRVKSEFLANMSHEIRTPLNGVIAVAGILSKTQLDKSQAEMVKLIESSGETLSHIINDVLDLARVESGRLEVEKIEFNLKDALNSVTALFGVKADEKGLIFNIESDENSNKIFLGDPTRLRQIIGNLLSNAIKFTSTGTVSLVAKSALIEGSENEYKYEFIITDTGEGMSEEVVYRLFERFEQADGSITRKHGGSGLGLSISRALAKLMGGDIEVQSELGKGSSFILSLPLKCANDCEVCNQDFSKAKLLNTDAKPIYVENIENDTKSDGVIEVFEDENSDELRILGVDDNATNRRVLDMVLRPMGVNLTLCENGLEALETYKVQNFDIILMDLQMPIMDGLTAIQKIRELEAISGKYTPIIAVSANAMSHHVEEAINAGADMHIAKPFTPQALIDGIERGLSLNENSSASDAVNYA
ncbi:MAG: response regulator [Caulobacterales bacterium]|nr:response regulator [Caulobacterales bacterium]MCA0373777.1 response regulator [Pseudomonadota bacterium]